MKAFKKFCLLTILSYAIFSISFIYYLVFTSGTGSLWLLFSSFFKYFVIASFSYVYIFERLQDKSENIIRNVLITALSIFILLLLFNGLFLGVFFAINKELFSIIAANYIFCICIFLLEYLSVTLSAYYSKSYKLVFNEKKLFYIKLIFLISTIVSLFGMILIMGQISSQSAFPVFYLSVKNLIAIFLKIGMHCLWVTSVSLVLIWGLSYFSWFKKNNLLIVIILFIAVLLLSKLTIQVYDNHYLSTIFDPSTLSGPLLMVVLLYRNKQRTTDLKLKSLTNAVSKKEAEYLQLKQQVNPHFLFNNLNVLISFIEIDPKKAVEFGHHLSNTYRHYLKNQNDDFVLLKEELEFIKEYLEIYKAKFENSFSFEISALPKENEYILSFSLQEIIDNVFKHNNMDDHNPLAIMISKSEGDLLIENTVSNKFSNQSNGVGLENINKRYEILTNKEIQIVNNETLHQVTLPILQLEA